MSTPATNTLNAELPTKVVVNPSDYTVFVVDDDEPIRDSVGETLTQAGFQVKTCASGEEAYDLIKNGDAPHVLVTDIRMGGMTGLELAQKVKQISGEVEVIIMTSHASFETAVQAMKIGVYDYLSKPFPSLDSVAKAVIRVCERIFLRIYSEYLTEEISKKNVALSGLLAFTQELSKSLEPSQIMIKATELLSKNFADAPCTFWGFDSANSTLKCAGAYPTDFFGETKLSYPIPTHIQSAHLEKFLQDDELFQGFLSELKGFQPEKYHGEDGHWFLKVLLGRESPLGIVMMQFKEPPNEQNAPYIEQFLEGLRLSLENSQLFAKTRESAYRDGLTGLYNARYFKERVKNEVLTAIRYQAPLSLIFFDVDHFKNFNDKNGHPAGDRLLKELAAILKSSCRGHDIPARYGGEEFVILLQRCTLANALKKAEILRKTIEGTKFAGGENQPMGKVTVSIGVSEVPTIAGTVEELTETADQALYRVKKSTRNAVAAAQPLPGYLPIFKPNLEETVSKR